MIAHRDRDYCQINDLLEIVATTRNKQSEPFMTKRLFFAKLGGPKLVWILVSDHFLPKNDIDRGELGFEP